MAHAARLFSTAGAAIVIGGILYIPHRYAPDLVPWVTGFMLACLAANLRAATE